jgi:RNA polymerase sigma-70 factor (ECF subfamily)
MSAEKRMERTAAALERNRDDLLRYVSRLLVRREIAEEVVQTTALRAIGSEAPEADEELRPWFFRIATNLAIDELRRHGNWRETMLLDARAAGEADAAFTEASQQMRATPEMAAIAREHLAFCFSCTLRNLEPRRAAALLLKEIYGFNLADIASILESRPAQVKNWLQGARHEMQRRYTTTCALINKRGVCYQCVELSEFFTGRGENPLAGSRGSISTRAAIVRELDARGLGKWHGMLLKIFDDLV